MSSAVLVLGFCHALHAAELPQGWEKLNLSSTQIQGTTVYYEKCLEAKLPIFEKVYKQYLTRCEEEKGKYMLLLTNREKIVGDIKNILGANDVNTATVEQNVVFPFLAVRPDSLCLVTKGTTKDFLRSGGKLPGFTYDKSTDTVTEVFELRGKTGTTELHVDNLVVTTEPNEAFEEDVSGTFEALGRSTKANTFAGTFHELIEVIMGLRLKPAGAHRRWFTDGFANAITYEFLKTYFGPEDAAEWASWWNVDNYKHLEKEINLQYWMYRGLFIETPIEYERRLQTARYRYATLEAERLIEKHGIDCVRKILDKACVKKGRTSGDLLMAIWDVTGEHMRERLGRYQTFDTIEGGRLKYAKLAKAADEKEDYATALTHGLRLLELSGDPLSPSSLQLRSQLCMILFKLGYEKYADEAMEGFLKSLEEMPQRFYNYFSELYLMYALRCEDVRRAGVIAEMRLQRDPENLNALTVHMKVLAESDKLVKAQAVAKRILTLDKDEKSYYRDEALKTLAIKQNSRDPTPDTTTTP